MIASFYRHFNSGIFSDASQKAKRFLVDEKMLHEALVEPSILSQFVPNCFVDNKWYITLVVLYY